MRDNYVSISVVIDKAMRHPLMRDLEYEQAIDYAVDFMRIVGIPQLFLDDIVTVNVKEYRAALPEQCLEIKLVKYDKLNICIREATDSFYLKPDDIVTEDLYNITYKRQGSVLFFSVKEGDFTISYRKILTDDNGIPMIPDNGNFYRALLAYIKKLMFTILFDMGKIQVPVINKAETDYAWAVGALETDLLKMDLGNAESFFNSIGGLLIKRYQFEQGFRGLGEKERLKFN